MGLFSSGRKEDSFITQLKTQAGKTIECIAFLQRNMDAITEETILQKKEMIDELANIKTRLMDDLHNTFITPIDREDIYNISISLFGVAKYSQTTLEEIHLLKVAPDRFIHEMVDKVKSETDELYEAISSLMKNPRNAYDHSLMVTKIETRIDKIYRQAVKDLFVQQDMLVNDLQNILYRREVYRHISNMSDKAEAAAEALGMAIIKLS